jgi:hypothetical protein
VTFKVLNNRILTNNGHPAFNSGIKYYGQAYNLVKKIHAFQKQLAVGSSNCLAHTPKNHL